MAAPGDDKSLYDVMVVANEEAVEARWRLDGGAAGRGRLDNHLSVGVAVTLGLDALMVYPRLDDHGVAAGYPVS